MRSFFICKLTIVALLIAAVSPAPAQIITKIVGAVGGRYLTSREVVGSRWIEKVLFPKDVENSKDVLDVNSVDFVKVVNPALMEAVVAQEADNFSIASVSENEQQDALVLIKKQFVKDSEFDQLHFAENEISELVLRKLKSKKFLKYKMDVGNITISDEEISQYFKKNHSRFGNADISQFKENIHTYLSRTRIQERLRDWFELLKKKYHVRNIELEK